MTFVPFGDVWCIGVVDNGIGGELGLAQPYVALSEGGEGVVGVDSVGVNVLKEQFRFRYCW